MMADRARSIPVLASLDIPDVPRLSPFEVRPWNMKEFYIHDSHGDLPKFGCGEW